MHLDAFGYCLTVEYIFLALGPIKQLLLASKSVPYYPKLFLSTPFYGNRSVTNQDIELIFLKDLDL